MRPRKRVAAIMTEYRPNAHADVIVGKMLDGIHYDGRTYDSTLDIASFYVDQFPEKDLSRAQAERHGIPIHDSIAGALTCGGSELAVDGILIIGEHGDYPRGTYGQKLYPRRRLFEECLDVMRAAGRFVPVFSDKHFAVETEDIQWVWSKVGEHQIPFMAGSSVVFAHHDPAPLRLPQGAPLHRMLAAYTGDVEAYGFHALEMLQSVAENRAYGESGIKKVRAFVGKAAASRSLSADWRPLLERCCGTAKADTPERILARLEQPVFFEVEYVDGLQAGLFWGKGEIHHFVSAYQVYSGDEPFAANFVLGRHPFRHFDIFVLQIERFMHTGRPPFPAARNYLTSGALDACMRALHLGEEIETPHLAVRY